MAKAKNLRIVTDEIKLTGLLNSEELETGIVVIKGEEEKEIKLHEYLTAFDGCEVEISIKKKIEETL